MNIDCLATRQTLGNRSKCRFGQNFQPDTRTNPERLSQQLPPRIALPVEMSATGTEIHPLENQLFSVKLLRPLD